MAAPIVTAVGRPSVPTVVIAACRRAATSPVASLLDQLQYCPGGHFDVEHSTIQLEPAGHGGHERDIHP